MIITLEDIQYMIRQNQADTEECKMVTESSMRGESYYANDDRPGEKDTNENRAFLKEVLYRDAKTAGFVRNYPHGTVITQGERNSYYRGENRIYPRSQPSVYRAMEMFGSEEEKQLFRFVAMMRVAEFGCFISKLGITRFWAQNYSDVLIEPLAQHYGFETEWLDITGDFMVALFFATCSYDGKTWHPLTRRETEHCEGSKYGVIFHIPQWQVSQTMALSSLWSDNGNKLAENVILPIGYQPFMRCQSQNAYGIHMEDPFPLQQDIKFEKLHFRHNESLSRAVYRAMDEGRRIFPQDGLDDFQDVIRQIQSATAFSEEAFEYALKKSKYFHDRDKTIELLRDVNFFDTPVEIIGSRHPFNVSRQRIKRCDMKYEGFSFQKKYGISLSTRMSLTETPKAKP